MPDDLLTETQTQTPPAPPAVLPPAAPAAVVPPPAAPPARLSREEEEDGRASDIRIRERKRALKEAYGTADPDEIAKIKQQQAEEKAKRDQEKQELDTLRAEREERDRAKMSEVERLQTDLNAEKEKNKTLEAQIQAAKQEILSERQNGAVKQAAVRHRIKNKASVMRVVLAEFGAHYISLTNLEKRRLIDATHAERYLDRWMRTFVKENPEMLDAPPAATTETTETTTETTQTSKPPAAKPPLRRPLGATGQRPPAPGQRVPPGPRAPGIDENGKTVKPGLPNSMNAAELAAYKRKQGLKAS